MKTTVILLALVNILWLTSCKKELVDMKNQTTSIGKLKFLTENKIKINQAVSFYDYIFIKDSLDFVSPPTTRYYEWKITPDNGCDSVFGPFSNSIPNITFHCPGEYKVTANIYDSLTRKLIGNTDTLDITVTQDILYPTQPIQANDTLKFSLSVVRVTAYPSGALIETFLQCIFHTSKVYDHNYQFDFTSALDYSYSFTQLRLFSYPFTNGFGLKSNVESAVDIKSLAIGIPAKLSITWLGKTYSGSITLLNNDHYMLDWVNSGAAVFLN
jgi:hypothetical protein